MRDMADLDAVHLGLDENEADIAEELQDFDSFDTRSEASKSRGGSMASDSEPSISSVSTAPSSIDGSRSSSKRLTKTKSSSSKAAKDATAKSTTAATTTSTTSAAAAGGGKSKSKKSSKRSASPSEVNGKKKKSSSSGSESKSKKQLEPDEKSSNSKSQDGEERDSSAKKSRSSSSSKKNTPTAAATAAGATGAGAKSDASDAEDEKPTHLPALESDSESSDSDSGTQHKRNGSARGKTTKATSSSKGSTPEKDGGASGNNTQKSYDYMTKLNYLFRDTRFFLIKSNNSDNVQLSKNKSVWATLPQNDANLNQAFKEARNVLLIFSVNESGKFAGFARMAAPSRRDIPQVAWVLPPSISPKALGGVIELDWICRKELSFNATLHLHNSWNEGKPVKIGRDGQEIEPKIGGELCRLFPEDENIELTPILRKSKETARVMREKGIHVIYKPPRSLSSRGHGGGGGGGRGNSQLGPMRHKRSYGHGAPHHHQRPYRHHHHHHHHGMGMGGMQGGGGGGGFKRSGSPYRQMAAGAAGGSAEMGMPSWERYMSTAAAAEAYVADYIRNMHGQLPPLPFVPPFGQLPMPTAAGAANALPPGAPASMYEQLPPPVRYYDGPGAPPLPDYPPPQPMRPPPPGFDKAPSYEDFAAWKNAGLPTVAAPPGFPGVYAANGGSSNATGNGGGGGGGGNGGGGGAVASISAGNRDNNNSSVGGRRRDYGGGGNRSGSSRQFRGDRGGGGGQRSYRDTRR
ncbi:YTH domain-containing protein 1 [Drosophila nasuta]|uniref:YTH domain-containing protein 1 n=1 Tax=Drosophila nasuta TaxID=42062 RepID=UPI00295EF02C|nr:YTH domain-containing protein 1 [Drosophila nasuta]